MPRRQADCRMALGEVTGVTDRFYQDLPVFRRFLDICDFSAYTRVPDDWVIMLSDVKGSTQAITEGRYKDVNMIGAATIIALINACKPVEVPFVFGGDGGTVLVPASMHGKCAEALCGLSRMSKRIFGLSLRVGAISVAQIRKDGHDIGIRKYELSRGNCLAMFSGSGLEYADVLLKQQTDGLNPYLVDCSSNDGEADLGGLSCRWEPLQPAGGKVLTLLVKAKKASGLKPVIVHINRITGAGLRAATPVKKTSLKFKWPPAGVKTEAGLTAGEAGFVRRYIAVLAQSLIQFLCERFGVRAGNYDPDNYRDELTTNTDFRKFDGLLRMVLDVSEDEIAAIEHYLEKQFQAGQLVYGTHISGSALMTCLLFSLENSEHVHFIDGSDGGFALAARQYKQRARQHQDSSHRKT